MILIIAKNHVKADKLQDFEAFASELVLKSSAEAGNVSYELFRSLEDPCLLTFVEKWRDEDAVAIHMNSPHFKAIAPKLGECCEGEMEITKYTRA